MVSSDDQPSGTKGPSNGPQKAGERVQELPFFSMKRLTTFLSKIPCSGIILGLMSGVFLATASFAVKMVHTNPIEIVIARGFIQLLVFLPVVFLNKGMSVFGVKGERLYLAIRGIGGFASFALLYISLRMIPLADASTIVFSMPIFVLVIAWLVLKEECGLFQVFVLTLTISGVVLISRPDFLFGQQEGKEEYDVRIAGTVCAIFASILKAVNYVAIRKMPKTQTAVIVNAFSGWSIACGFIVLAVVCVIPFDIGFLGQDIYFPTDGAEIGYLVLNGVCGVLGQFCVTLALKVEEAGLVSLARTADIVVSFAFQMIWLPNEVVQWTSVLGAVAVTLSVSLSALKRWLKDHPGKWELVWLILNCSQRERQTVEEAAANQGVSVGAAVP